MTPLPRRLTLIHNATAGDGRHDRDGLVGMIAAAGYSVRYFNTKDHDAAVALREPTDLIVVAGGDGTVRRVVSIAEPDHAPIAILPLGSANNIAKSLRIEGPLERLIESWQDARQRPFFPISADAPWGRQRLVEGLGFGVLAQAIEELRSRKPPPPRARRHIAELVLRAEPEALDIRADGADLSGVFLLFEVVRIPLVGPNLLLAPTADPSDELDISFIGDSAEERWRLAAWLEREDETAPSPAAIRSARRVSIAGRFRRVRVDDAVRICDTAEIATIELAPEAQPLYVLVPR
jgi:diacylglycerol kinase family enzyme